jgi:integrase
LIAAISSVLPCTCFSTYFRSFSNLQIRSQICAEKWDQVTLRQTPVLDPDEARHLLDSIDTATPTGLRDRALIALMVYSFARIGAAVSMKVEDFAQNWRLWVRLHEKGGKDHAMPCRHNLEQALTLYVDGTSITAYLKNGGTL